MTKSSGAHESIFPNGEVKSSLDVVTSLELLSQSDSALGCFFFFFFARAAEQIRRRIGGRQFGLKNSLETNKPRNKENNLLFVILLTSGVQSTGCRSGILAWHRLSGAL